MSIIERISGHVAAINSGVNSMINSRKKANEIIEKNKNTNTVLETIKTKIENNEAITTDDFEEVFDTDISPN